MSRRYVLKLPTEYLESPQKDNFEKELRGVQDYFDDTSLQLEVGFLSFVFLKGFYSHMNRLTYVVGVFVNALPDEVLAFSGSLRLRHVGSDDFRAEVDILVKNESIDELKTNEGVLAYLEVPTQGVVGNATFETSEIEATFADVEYVKLSDEASEEK